ncbi:tRNA (adenosine(37)-N6)-threonylcarbamoyltransferase complex transferase subunit TsaD [Candidatus Saccharibacteria bacterium]|nr:tRNA (adenosine(37)-N6)-threonylcarbamoyltransferase complex transferase subunit TsaD [Candidatus Saccharibacteria bacterium]
MYILGVESSCDETAAAVVKDGKEILSNVVVSQIDIFKEYGGVIPEVAARSHLEAILPVVEKALKDANLTWTEIDSIAVTHTPGLLGSLLIGTLTARTLAILHDKPLYPVHHLKSHIYTNWLGDQTPEFPLLALVVSGGHTQIIRMTAHNHFEIIGTTRDDAVGECFDKVAKILGLPYPGGPSISQAAKNGDPKRYHFPHPKLTSPNRSDHSYSDLDFSFSGLKTAVLREVQKAVGKSISFPSYELKNLLTKEQVADFAASFENTATDILIENLKKALERYPDTKSICLAGGVSANDLLREKSRTVFLPDKSLSGDNGAMVAAAAFYEIESGVHPTDPYSVSLAPRSAIDRPLGRGKPKAYSPLGRYNFS